MTGEIGNSGLSTSIDIVGGPVIDRHLVRRRLGGKSTVLMAALTAIPH